ncbi:MAG: HemK/PrmC family methyltransferase [Candidatus Jacksonbacteria bacterium]
MSTIKQALADATQQLQKANIPSPHLDGEILLAHALGKPKEFLYAHPEAELSKSAETKHSSFIQRRLNREPIAYIINKKEFYGREFYVDKRVLIPRPCTEKIVDKVIQYLISNIQYPKVIIDIGTGSGCIIISLVKELLKLQTNYQLSIINYSTFIATDISADALTVAKINAKKHKVDHLIKFYQGDLLEPIIKSIPKLFTSASSADCRRGMFNFSLLTFITANLPYITPKNYLILAPEIKKYEPKLALLTPDENADYYYKKLNQQIAELQKMTKAKIWKFYEKSTLN